jgi:hypothetical protein
MPISSKPYNLSGFLTASTRLPIKKLPNASPPIKTDKTVVTARWVPPKIRLRERTHTTSYIRAAAPDKKKIK